MTFEEAKEVFLNLYHDNIEFMYDIMENSETSFAADKWAEAVLVISAYLKKNSDDDCISRQAVKDLVGCYIHAVEIISEYGRGYARTDKVLEQLLGNICSTNALPPVSPQIKKGHWIDITNKNGTVIALRCSCCKESPKHAIRSAFCPNCGAEMLEKMGC